MDTKRLDAAGRPIEEPTASDASLEQVLQQLAHAPEYSFDETAGMTQRTAEPLSTSPVPQAVPRLEGYELMEELGRGGMGAVYKARQKGTGQMVAVKVILGRRSQHPESVRRFEREIRLLGRLQHPRIAAIHTAGTTAEGDPYFAMELVEGVTLDRHLSQEPSLYKRLELFRKICEAVAHSHRLGILHRDLKPQNVMICAGGSEVKVLDFGLGRIVSAEPDEAQTQTLEGLVQGTLPYMSPEQISGEPVTTLSDLYSLGVMLYEVLTGQRPYDVPSRSLAAAERIICEAAPRPPSKIVRGLNRKKDLDALVLKSLEKTPARRYQTVDELSKDLENYMTNRPILPRQVHLRAFRTMYTLGLFCRRNLAAVLVAMVATAALAGLGLGAFYSVEQQRIRAEASAATSTRLLTELYERDGRQWMSSGDPIRAAVYLGEAYRLGKADPSLRLLLRLGAKALQDEVPRIFEERPGVFDRVTLSPDGQRLLTIDAMGAANLWHAASGKKLLTLSNPLGELTSAAFSPDGTQVVTASKAGAVQIWDSAGGRLHSELEDAGLELGVSLHTAAFSPDGSRVAASGRQTRVWDLRTRKLLFSTSGSPVTRGIPVFTPDGSKLVVAPPIDGLSVPTAFNDSIDLQILDAGTGKVLTTVKQKGMSLFLMFSPDSSKLLAQSMGGGDGPAVYDASSGEVLLTLKDPEKRASQQAMARFSPDGSRIVTASGTHPLRVWDAADGSLIATMEGDGKGFLFPSFSPDGKLAASGSLQGELRIWESQTGQQLASAQVPSMWLTVFSPDGKHILTSSTGATAVLELPTNRVPVTIRTASQRLEDVEFSEDGGRISTESHDGHARLWEAATGHQLSAFKVPGEVWDASFHPDGRWLVSVFDPSGVRIFEAQSGKLVATLEGAAPGTLQFTRFSPDGRFLLALTDCGGLKAWDLKSGQPAAEAKAGQTVAPFWMVASPDGSRLLAPDTEIDAAKRLFSVLAPALRAIDQAPGLVLRRSRSLALGFSSGPRNWELVDGPRGRSIATSEGNESNAVTFSPDGARAMIVRGAVLEILDAATGKSEATIDPPWGPSLSVEFSPAGNWIALGGPNGQVRLVDSSDGALLTSFRTIEGLITDLTFSPDGSRLAVSHNIKSVSILELGLETRSPAAYARLLRCLAPWRLQDGRLVPVKPPADCSP